MKIVATDRPPFPSPDADATIGSIDKFTAMKRVAQYETAMVHWLCEIRLLADPTLSPSDSIMAGSSFDTFWRTLIYNCQPRFNYDLPNQRSEPWLATHFGYWYLLKKFHMTRRWQDNVVTYAFHSKFLQELAAPFEEAEGRVRHARKFFVSEQGRIGWIPFRAQAGDQICVFRGMRIPVIIRSQGSRWEFIGASYVHGLMDGEVWDLDDLQWDFMSFV